MVIQSTYKISPIGVVAASGKIAIDTQFLRGLRQIEQFSHLRVLWGNRGGSDFEYQIWGDNRLSLATVALRKVDGAHLYFEGRTIPKGASVFDLKAYIPMTDRVKSPQVPAQIESGVWFDPRIERMGGQDDMSSPHIISSIGTLQVRKNQSIICVDTPYRDRLKTLTGFSHLNCIWFFSRFDKPHFRRMLECRPPYQAPKTGVFASRAPLRPNPLALSVCRIHEIDLSNGEIHISETDAFSDTPVIGITAYLPAFDRVEQVSVPNWISHWPRWLEEGEDGTVDVVKGLKPAEIRVLEIFDESSLSEAPQDTRPHEKSIVASSDNCLEVVGARQNNLKNVTVTIPLNRLTTITGVSGSGKSSLAFDTIFAEGQRRYMQSLSAVSQFYRSEVEKPDVDHISNLLPSVAIKQKRMNQNPRSTLGSVTDVYSYLRLLYSRLGERHCTRCGSEILPVSATRVTRRLMTLPKGTHLQFRPGRRDESKKTIASITLPPQDASLRVADEIRRAVDTCYDAGSGFLTLWVNDDTELCVTSNSACTRCGAVYFRMNSSMFSYNSPQGMCKDCNGLGQQMDISPERVIRHPDRSLLDGASPWYGNLRKQLQKPNANWMRNEVLALAKAMKVDLEKPWNALPEDFRQKAMYGTEGKEYEYSYDSKKTGRSGTIRRPVKGAIPHLRRLLGNSRASNSHEVYKSFLSSSLCPSCHGERLAEEGRFVTLFGTRYPDVARMTVGQAIDWSETLLKQLSDTSRGIAENIIGELRTRLNALHEVGLHYLGLDRPVTTLSGGESQRVKLAGQLENGLSGLLYVLDEPSVGLHAKEQAQMIDTLKRLQKQGNTVVVVEHAPEVMMASDYIIDMGKGGGAEGGEIVAAGSIEAIMACSDSATGAYLKSMKQGAGFVSAPASKKKKAAARRSKKQLTIRGATLHNLKEITVSFPIGRVSCVTGVSGSGKTSLIGGTLVPALRRRLHDDETTVGPYEQIAGLEHLDSAIHVDQSPIGRSRRSTPATYIGVFDEIRSVFAASAAAKKKRYKVNRFSYNDKSGRCPQCEGLGMIKVDMSFLPDAMVTCSDCNGRRYSQETLDVTINGVNIADVLSMDVTEALAFFEGEDKIYKSLQVMSEVGLGYLKLGQSATTLSGGEAQRIKLAKELVASETGRTLYILDEPTIGLHHVDVEKLMTVVFHLAELGNTVIIIEHNLSVIRRAHHVVDLGPAGGEAGGELIASGPPSLIAQCKDSVTGQYLRDEGGA